MGEHDGHRERMRKRFLRCGLSNFDDHTILEFLLFYALPRQDTNRIAHRLLSAFGTLAGVFDATPEALMTVDGIGESAAALIRLVPEAARRGLIAGQARGTILHSADEVGRFLIPRFLNTRGEAVYLICLDPKKRVIDCRQIGSGDLTSVSVSVRQIVELALMLNAAAVILAHNHPNGLALPSEEDRVVTLRVRDALRPVSVTLLDHIIVADGDFVSMAESGLL